MDRDVNSQDLNQDRTGYDPTTNTYHQSHEWNGKRPLVVTLVRSVTAVTGDDPTEIEPLYDSVDVDALESLLRSVSEKRGSDQGFVEFEFNDHRVTVRDDGDICVLCKSRDIPPSQ